MRRLKRPGAVMGLLALGLEAAGVASGAYVYGDFPIKILGVPLSIPVTTSSALGRPPLSVSLV